MRLRSAYIRWIVLGLAVLLSLPFLPEPISGLYLWISPYILLIAVLNGKSLVWLHLLGLVTLGIIIFRKRWICRYACPAGVICDLSSKIGRKATSRKRLNLNRYLALFALVMAVFGAPVLIVADPFNLFYMAFEGIRTGWGWPALIKLSGVVFLILFSLLLPHLWCSSVCPLGGFQFLLYDLKEWIVKRKTPSKATGTNRRFFVAGLTGVLGGLLIPRLFPNRTAREIRPPFSLPETRMNLTCARCGNCSSVCPTGIITQSLDIRKPESLLTPLVRFQDSYCLPECNACGIVCPSGAIRHFSKEEKKDHVMGVAVIQLDRCYLQQGRECTLCRQYCAYAAIEFSTAGPGSVRFPRVVESKCVGCGACQVICPPRVIEIIRTYRRSFCLRQNAD